MTTGSSAVARSPHYIETKLGNIASGEGAEMVAYKLNAVGAAVRNVFDRLEEFVSVKDFGAVGDGVTDDTTAIQAAIDSGIKNLRGVGTFLLAGSLSVQTDDITLKLEKVKKITAGSCIVAGTYTGVAATNVMVNNFRFAGAFEGPGYRSATEVIGIDEQLVKYCHYWIDRSTHVKSVFQRKSREGMGTDHPTSERSFIYRAETFEVDYPIVALPVTVDLGNPTYTTYAGSRELWLSNLNLARAITNIKLEDVDGVHISQFTLFQDPTDASTRLDNIELHDCEHISISDGNCFEAGRNGIRASDCKNLNIADSLNVVWSGEQSEAPGIYCFSRDTNAESDNYKINATVDGCSGDGILIDGTGGTTINTVQLNAIVDDNSNNTRLGGASLAGVYSGITIKGVNHVSGLVTSRGNSRQDYGLVAEATVLDLNVMVSSRGDVSGDASTQPTHNIFGPELTRVNNKLTVNGEVLFNKNKIDAVTILTDISTGHDVSDVNTIQVTNSTARTISHFTGYTQGKTLEYVCRDANTTFEDSAGGAGQFKLKGGIDRLLTLNELVVFKYINAVNAWIEK